LHDAYDEGGAGSGNYDLKQVEHRECIGLLARPKKVGAMHSERPDVLEGTKTFHRSNRPTSATSGSRSAAVGMQGARLLALQRSAGNAAVAQLLSRGPSPTVQRCGPVPCDCSSAERAANDDQMAGHDTHSLRISRYEGPPPPPSAAEGPVAGETAAEGAIAGETAAEGAVAGETGGAAAGLSVGAALAGLVAGAVVFFWPRPTAPPWMDSINPITGIGYTSEEEYRRVGRMSQAEREAARRHRKGAPAPAPDDHIDPQTGEPHKPGDPCDLLPIHSCDGGMTSEQAIAQVSSLPDFAGSQTSGLQPVLDDDCWTDGRGRPRADALAQGATHQTWNRPDGTKVATIKCCPCCVRGGSGTIGEHCTIN
jgi:hypothetical protein